MVILTCYENVGFTGESRMWSVGDRDDDGVWTWQAKVAGGHGGRREKVTMVV